MTTQYNAQSWCQRHDAPARTIAMAVNDTAETRAAFAWARANLFRKQDLVILIHAYDRDTVFGTNANRELGVKVLLKYENLCKAKGVNYRVVLAQGSPEVVISEATKTNSCDMCVIGSRGLNIFKRAVLGSVSEFEI